MPASSKISRGVHVVGGEHREPLAALLHLAQVLGADPLRRRGGLAPAPLPYGAVSSLMGSTLALLAAAGACLVDPRRLVTAL